MIIHTKTTLKSYNLDIEVEISEKSIGTVRYEVCSNFTQDKKKIFNVSNTSKRLNLISDKSTTKILNFKERYALLIEHSKIATRIFRKRIFYK